MGQILSFKGWLTSHNIKQSEIAELLGVSYNAVNNKVNGKQAFTLAQVAKICDTYNISADIFLPEKLQKSN